MKRLMLVAAMLGCISACSSGDEDSPGMSGGSGKGGSATGGASTGGASTGGSGTAGASSGGASSGGASGGGASSGGSSSGGSATAGAGTGGVSAGGANVAGSGTGGAATAGAGGAGTAGASGGTAGTGTGGMGTVPDAVHAGCVGFACLDGMGNQTVKGGVTGGKGGKVVYPKTAEEFISSIAAPEPLIVVVEGTLNLPINQVPDGIDGIAGGYPVASNKTIVGKGASAKLVGAGLLIGKLPFDDNVVTPPADAPNNIVIRNITFDGTGGVSNNTDGINIFMHAHHVWVDHCSFTKQADGALDIKRGASWVTVSWSHFYGVNKTTLVGHNDANGKQDTGYLKSTFHHNFYDGTTQRHPRVRFGEVHAFNNYLKGTSEGMGCGTDSKIYAEKCQLGADACYDKGGHWQNVDNVFEASEVAPSNVGWTPSTYYKYTADPVNDVPSLVPAGAGAGKIDLGL